MSTHENMFIYYLRWILFFPIALLCSGIVLDIVLVIPQTWVCVIGRCNPDGLFPEMLHYGMEAIVFVAAAACIAPSHKGVVAVLMFFVLTVLNVAGVYFYYQAGDTRGIILSITAVISAAIITHSIYKYREHFSFKDLLR